MRIRAHAGQAAVEAIGIAVVVALLLAATAAWLASAAGRPGPPPAVIAHVSESLRVTPDAGLLSGTSALPQLLRASGGGRGAPIGRMLRTTARAVATGVVIGMEARQEFAVAYGERLRERAVDLLRHPLGDGVVLPDLRELTPQGAALVFLGHAGELWDYGRHLRTLPPRVAIMTASRDLGRLSADLSVQLAQGALRRALTRAGRGAPPPAPGGGDARPAP